MFATEQKHEQWKAITESDFVTLYIKTWFTYISVLRTIFPEISSFTEDGKARGDKPFLNAFVDDVLPYIRSHISIGDLFDDFFIFYPVCMKKVKVVFPQYYFQTFYRYNENFKFSDVSIDKRADGRIAKRWQLDVKVEKRYYLRGCLSMSGIYRNIAYNEKIKFEVDVKAVVNRAIEESNFDGTSHEVQFLKNVYDGILGGINSKFTSYVSDKVPTLPYNNTIHKILRDGCVRASSTLRVQFQKNYEKFPHEATTLYPSQNEYAVIEQHPFARFSEVPHGNAYLENKPFYDRLLLQNGLLWLSDFVYQLRNALFHEIINPLDADWQTIFKTAYFLLKPMTDICIGYLEKIKVICDDEDDYIARVFENETFDCFDKLSTHTRVVEISGVSVKQHKLEQGNTFLCGTVDVSLNLQYGSDHDNRNGDGNVEERTVTCDFSVLLDVDFDVIRSRDGEPKMTLELSNDNIMKS